METETELSTESYRDFFQDNLYNPTSFENTLQWTELRYLFYYFSEAFKKDKETNEQGHVMYNDRRAIIYEIGKLMNEFQDIYITGDLKDIFIKGKIIAELFSKFFSNKLSLNTDFETRMTFLTEKNPYLHTIIDNLTTIYMMGKAKVRFIIEKVDMVNNLFIIATFLKTFILYKWPLEGDDAVILATENLNKLKFKLSKLTPLGYMASIKCMNTIYKGQNDQIYVILSFNDKYFITGHENGLITLWSKLDCSCLKILNSKNTQPSITSLVSINDKYFASGQSNGCIKIWDIKTNKCIRKILTKSSVLAMEILYNKNLVTGHDDSTIKIFHTRDGIFTANTNNTNNNNNDTITTNGNSNNTSFLNMSNGMNQTYNNTNNNTSLSHSYLVEDNLCLINLYGESRVLSFTNLAIDYFASGHMDNIKIWNLSNSRCMHILTLDASVLTLALITTTHFSSGQADGGLVIWKINNNISHRSNNTGSLTTNNNTTSTSTHSTTTNNHSNNNNTLNNASNSYNNSNNELSNYHDKGGFKSGEVIKDKDDGTYDIHDQNINNDNNNEKDLYLSQSNNTTHVVKFQSITKFKTLSTHSAVLSIISLTERIFVTGHEDSIKIWCTDEYTCLETYKTIEDYSIINSVAALSDHHFASCHSDGSLKLWTFKDNNCYSTLMNENQIKTLNLLPDGKLAVGIKFGDLKVVNVKDKNFIGNFSSEKSVIEAVGVLSDHEIIVGYQDSYFKLFNTQDGRCTKQIYHDCIDFAFDRRNIIYISNLDKLKYSDDKVTKIGKEVKESKDDSNNNEIMPKTISDGDVVCITAITEGRYVVGYSLNKIKIYSIKSGRCLKELYLDGNHVKSICQISDGRLISGHTDGVKVWNTRNGRCLNTLSFGNSPVISLTLLTDNTLAIGYENGEIKIWNTKSSKCLKKLSGGNQLTCLAALPDNNFVSSHKDGTIKLWKVNENRCYKIFYNKSEITCLVVLKDGNLASGDTSGAVKFWLIDGFQM